MSDYRNIETDCMSYVSGSLAVISVFMIWILDFEGEIWIFNAFLIASE